MMLEDNEIGLIIDLLEVKLEKINRELTTMHASSEHFFVNEGLLNEVRHESNKLTIMQSNIKLLIDKLIKERDV